MILILAEKPSAKRNFAKALDGTSGTYAGVQYKICALEDTSWGCYRLNSRFQPSRQTP